MQKSTEKLDVGVFKLSDKRSDLLFLARTAEAAGRYEDMCQFMSALVAEVNKQSDLTVEERSLLSAAYQNVVDARRVAWRSLNADENRDNELINTYRGIIEDELEKICREVLNLLVDYLVPYNEGKANEPEVFYLKMAGDYYRYLADFKAASGYGNRATENYETAHQIAQDSLPPVHLVRLGLALNYSACLYEVHENHQLARVIAKKTFDDAMSKLDQVDEASYKDATHIMQLLRDNLDLWTLDDED